MLNSTVRWFHHQQPGAPQINAEAGDLIAILDACLLNGFDSKTADSLVVASGVATFTRAAGHDYEKHAVIRIAGATPSDLNGDWRITAADATTFTFATPSIADGTATGTITSIRATPGSWEKAHSGTNLAAYRSTHVNASGCHFRIDDSPATTSSSLVRGYESMSDIDTGTRPFPTVAQVALANYTWRRSNSTNGSLLPRPWTLIADDRFFWFFVDWHTTVTYPSAMYHFGDIARFSASDAFPCVIVGHATASGVSPGSSMDANNFAGSYIGCYFARPASGLEVDPIGYQRLGCGKTAHPGGGTGFPHAITDGYLFHHPVLVASGATAIAGIERGFLPGGMQSLTDSAATLGTPTLTENLRLILDPAEAFPRAIMLVAVSSGSSNHSHFAVDIFGPWR
jgi:hypothetical protein